jgi:hypothetical protein
MDAPAARDPYAAPAARVEDVVPADGEPVFFAVGTTKFAVMSLATLQLYLVYWFYRNWKCVQRFADDKPNAPVRALFFPLVSYSLFQRINARSTELGVPANVAAGGIAIGLFFLNVVSRAPDPWWLPTFLQFALLLPVQSAVNRLNAQVAPKADRNVRYSGWNIAAIVVGGLTLLLAIYGTLFPVQ